ncbi:ATPase components of ABC transporters with duplicated ATPase domains [Kytococcus aerolatus]|uniref:ATPase components of ABC transporters with duplicated ATPase domains n=1 Tax=Kytococcus aerolatus TaxID=592308 RepID=A0A212U5Z2_9MICO|nr:ATPase components of ABC transporters with duplicated ATPase domains [Kytococcus aerolatus]
MNPPANLLNAEALHLVYGTRTLLDQVTLGLNDGDRIGVVGRNGGGKSTLLKVLAGLAEPDSGRVVRSRGATVGMLRQRDDLAPDATVRDVVLPGLAEHEWAADARVRGVLTGLLGGLDAEGLGGLDTPVAGMSGGERRRMALAALLVEDPDVVLLDEPTNHLDVEGVAWLAEHLRQNRRSGQALVVVTHDRWFLDAVVDQTWEVVEGQVHQYEGGYAAFVQARAERARVEQATEEKRQNILRKELAWLRRGAPARTSKPKFRIEAADALIAGEPEPRDEVALARFATTRLGKDVYDLVNATVRVPPGAPEDEQTTLLAGVTWRLGPGDRFGIVGVNGAGKSTLLRVLLEQVPLAGGKLKVGRTVQPAILSQDLRELDEVEGMTVIDALTTVRSYTVLDGKEVSASSLAKRLGFSGQRQQSLVSELSGGERRRLQFVRLLLDEPNVLMLDEPTNDLDIETLTSMEDVLDGWAGTLLVVSHDRYLLERMANRQVALLGDGRIRDLPGGVEQYLELRRELRDAGRGTGRGGRDLAADEPASAAPAGGSTGASGLSAAEERQLTKAMSRAEKQMEKATAELERVHAEMAEAATDPERLATLGTREAQLREQHDAAEAEWLEAAEQLG